MKDLYQYIKPKNSFSMVMVGDILAHGEVYNDAKRKSDYDFKPMFSYIKPIIKQHDIAFCNQESILGGKKLGLYGGEWEKIGLEENPRFCSPYELGDAVVDCGFNLIALANNHVMDNGEDGIRNSLDYWRQHRGVITSGSWNSEIDRMIPKIHYCNGIKYGFIAYTTKTNTANPPKGKEYLLNVYSDELAKNDIEKLKDKVDLIIVSMHWGTEYDIGKTNYKQRKIATYLSKLGVNIIIGHHPHVVQPIEKINDTLVIYSLGNCLACQDGDIEMKRIGAMVSLNVQKNENKISIDNVKTELLYCYYNDDHKDFKIIPFSSLNNTQLKNHKDIEKKYLNFIH